MEAKGPRHERESVLCWNEEDQTASLWTASAAVYRRMKKRGWFPSEDGDRHALFHFPKAAIRLPINREGKPKRGKPKFIREASMPGPVDVDDVIMPKTK